MILVKIKKGNHPIKLVPDVMPNHIPLAYLYGDKRVYDCNIVQEIPATGIRKIIPYERFDSYEKVFFESSKSKPESLKDLIPIEAGEYLKRDQEGYYYEPESSIRFEPERFFYSVLAQRTQEYKSHAIYDLRISCVEKKTELAESLIQIFADAPERGLVRDNVWVNSKDLSSKSLANSKFVDNDFLFIQTKNGELFTANDERIDYDTLLNNHVNIWLCCSDITLLEKGNAKLDKSILYNEPLICDDSTFLISSFNDKYLPKDGKTVSLFDGNTLSCIVKHYDNRGFIIISSEAFIKNAVKNYKIIYEVLMQIYLQGYVSSKSYAGFVCDESIDYIVKRNKVITFPGFRSDKPFYELLNSYSAFDFNLKKVNISTNTVKVSHTPDYIYFKKVGGANLPKKPNGAYAIVLETQEIAYITKWHYIADTQIGFETNREEEHLVITLLPFCLNHTYVDKKTTLRVPLFEIIDYEKKYIENGAFYIVSLNKQLYCVKTNDWNKKGDVLLTVYLYLTDAPIELIDMRIRGGGLPENRKDNYSLLDIGHIKGRPFRESGSYLIKLPIEAMAYHDEIQKIIGKISVADRFFTVIYEKRNDEFEKN